MATKIKPIGQRVLLQRVEAEQVAAGGIIIPDTAKEKPQEAKVVAVGTGAKDDKGKSIPFRVKAGQTVLISKYGGNEIKIDGVDYVIIDEDDIIAICE